ncbi:MAG: asparagine synthetase B [Tunicatimonas sp.]
MRKAILLSLFLLYGMISSRASHLLMPMDQAQSNHLKAYGIAYWVLQQQETVDWLLNYRGGTFVCEYSQKLENECVIRGVKYEVISDAQYNQVVSTIASPSSNMDLMKLEKHPKIAVYSPKNKQPWDDAVTLALTYAEIPYEVVFDDEVLYDKLPEYDWLHVHHEDFTGQYGKFYRVYRNAPWYISQQRSFEETARKHGYAKVSELKLAVVNKIRDFVSGGGFMFAMCAATDTYDIALAAAGVDIVESMFDGDRADPNAQSKLKFENTFAFQNFQLIRNPYEYEFSTIDVDPQTRGLTQENDYFNLFEFSAKWDPIPTMLVQNHERIVKGFMGQTTAFRKEYIRPDVLVLGENKTVGEAKYLHGEFGKGFWTFYGGHDPEDYQHRVGEAPTDLNLHPNSPGYRLILNNILFPAAKKKKQKT